MKKIIYSLAVCLTLTTASFAQKAHKTLSPEQKATKQTANIKAKLSLSEEQASKAQALFLAQANKAEEWKKSEAEGHKVSLEDRRAFKKEQHKKLKAILTPEQQKAWSEAKRQPKQKRQSSK